MQPGATTSKLASLPLSSPGKVSSLSFSRPPLPVFNHFDMLSKECLFLISLSPMSKSGCQCPRRKHCLSVALRISSAAISSTVLLSLTSSAILSSSAYVPVLASSSSTYDLGSDDPIMLLCTMNENHHATCMRDSGASS